MWESASSKPIMSSAFCWRAKKRYQVQHPPTHGITANLGGDDRTTVVIVQRLGA